MGTTHWNLWLRWYTFFQILVLLKCTSFPYYKTTLFNMVYKSFHRWTMMERVWDVTHTAGIVWRTCCTWKHQQVLGTHTVLIASTPLMMTRWQLYDFYKHNIRIKVGNFQSNNHTKKTYFVIRTRKQQCIRMWLTQCGLHNCVQ